MLFSNDWYPALAQPNVDVVTEPVVEVLPDGVRSADGAVHEVDVIIYGTGFAATEFLAPMQITGVDGADLHERWKGGARAYLGLCVPDFPNLFVVYGPNTNLGGSSIINMLEAASGAITTLLRHTERAGARSVAVRPEAEERYDDEIQERLRDSVWASCHNWYHEDGGRITTNWPGQVKEYQERCADLDLGRLRDRLTRGVGQRVGQPDQLEHVLGRRTGGRVQHEVLAAVGGAPPGAVQGLDGRAGEQAHPGEVDHDPVRLRPRRTAPRAGHRRGRRRADRHSATARPRRGHENAPSPALSARRPAAVVTPVSIRAGRLRRCSIVTTVPWPSLPARADGRPSRAPCAAPGPTLVARGSSPAPGVGEADARSPARAARRPR